MPEQGLRGSKFRLKLIYFLGVTALVVGGFIYYRNSRINDPRPLDNLSLDKVYIITRSYGGQMTRAIRNMMMQQCWAGTFRTTKVAVVEPFSTESTLVNTPQIWSEVSKGKFNTAVRFSDYYDLKYYNKQSMKHKGARLVCWEDFLHEAPRKAIAISIPSHSCSGLSAPDCSYSKSFTSFINSLHKMGFDIINYICLSCHSMPLNLQKFTKLMFGNHNISKISIFMDTWRNYGFTHSWLQVPDHCKLSEEPQHSSDRLIPSSLVVQHSKYYLNRFIKGKNVTTIMLRIERFLTLAATGRSNETVESCLKKTVQVCNKIKSVQDGVFTALDVGKYGSGRMQSERVMSHFGKISVDSIKKNVVLFFKQVYNGTLTLKNWEDTFEKITGGKTERGYIAMVQQNIASESNCLILMGGGSFQQVAAQRYLHNHKDLKNPCLYTVCASNSFTKSLLYRTQV